MQRNLMTPEGKASLEAELKHAKSVLRPQVVRDIEDARAHGDISENSEFEDAKHRQGLLEGRIRDLEGRVATAEVVDVHQLEPSDRVVFGVTVDLFDLETEEELTYRIVGEDESDVKGGKISFTSPIGRALLGRRVGDEVRVETPRGVRTFEIADARYE